MDAAGLIETLPPRASAARQPVLLQSLEALLLDELGGGERAAACGRGRRRDPLIAQNLSLHAHSKVLAAFIRGFSPAHRPLLAAVHAAYDAAVRRGVACALENGALRRQLLGSRRARREAAQAERARVVAAGAPARQALHARIAEAQQRAERAQGRARRALKDLAACRDEQERAQQAGRAARAAKQRHADGAASEQEWGARPGAARVLALEAGPLSPQEEEELDAEMGVAGVGPLAGGVAETVMRHADGGGDQARTSGDAPRRASFGGRSDASRGARKPAASGTRSGPLPTLKEQIQRAQQLQQQRATAAAAVAVARGASDSGTAGQAAAAPAGAPAACAEGAALPAAAAQPGQCGKSCGTGVFIPGGAKLGALPSVSSSSSSSVAGGAAGNISSSSAGSSAAPAGGDSPGAPASPAGSPLAAAPRSVAPTPARAHRGPQGGGAARAPPGLHTAWPPGDACGRDQGVLGRSLDAGGWAAAAHAPARAPPVRRVSDGHMATAGAGGGASSAAAAAAAAVDAAAQALAAAHAAAAVAAAEGAAVAAAAGAGDADALSLQIALLQLQQQQLQLQQLQQAQSVAAQRQCAAVAAAQLRHDYLLEQLAAADGGPHPPILPLSASQQLELLSAGSNALWGPADDGPAPAGGYGLYESCDGGFEFDAALAEQTSQRLSCALLSLPLQARPPPFAGVDGGGLLFLSGPLRPGGGLPAAAMSAPMFDHALMYVGCDANGAAAAAVHMSGPCPGAGLATIDEQQLGLGAFSLRMPNGRQSGGW
ncbi:MAG: hypothetical protein J3K34DRAFT_493647 [Monoraphidium minutum]|nr:MAG: hypothetical protein J3K34DRAFT_493647 [Monoraphidium minutum]